MANIRSAQKRARQNLKNRLRNNAHKSQLKTTIKKYQSFIAEENLAAAKEVLPATLSLIDKSVNQGILHRNKVAHKKSALMKQLNNLEAK